MIKYSRKNVVVILILFLLAQGSVFASRDNEQEHLYFTAFRVKSPEICTPFSQNFPFDPVIEASQDDGAGYVPFTVLEYYSTAMFSDWFELARSCFSPCDSVSPAPFRNLSRCTIDNSCWPFVIASAYYLTRYSDIGDTTALAQPVEVFFCDPVEPTVDSIAPNTCATVTFANYDSLRAGSEALFEHLVEIAEEQENLQLKAAALFGLGSLYGLDAVRAESDGHTFSAFGPSMKSAKYMREAYELDSTLTDAMLSSSLYDYWVSKTLGWTPFKRDNREKALENIRSVMQSGSYSRNAAAGYLSWLLIEEERYDEAAAIADSMLLVFPGCRAFLEPAGKACFKAEDWTRARARYDEFVQSLRGAPVRNVVREIGALHRLGKIASAQEDWNAVIRYAEEAHAIPLNKAQMDRKKDDLKRLTKMREEALQHLEKE